MRRTLVVVMVVTACLALLSPPAAAHRDSRDPFDPVIDPNAAVTTGTTGTVVTDTTTGATETTTEIGSDGLAATGTDPEPWVVLAYALLVLGAGAVAGAKLNTPHPARRYPRAS